MDLCSFRLMVNEAILDQPPLPQNLPDMYDFLGLPNTGRFSSEIVCGVLYERIRMAFGARHQIVWQQCRDFEEELIHDHVLEETPLDPYFEVVTQIRDAVRSPSKLAEASHENWRQAVELTLLNMQTTKLETATLSSRVYPQAYSVGYAASRLRHGGYPITRTGPTISLDSAAETRLIGVLEKTIINLGGLNVAWRLFKEITKVYDFKQQRYHVVVPTKDLYSHPGTLIPFGYILLLAVKHFDCGNLSSISNDIEWRKLMEMSRDYAILLGVRDYTRFPMHSYQVDKIALTVLKTALSDTVFRIPQLRGDDVVKIIRGVLVGWDFDAPLTGGWSLNQAITVADALLHMSSRNRGPMSIHARDVRRACKSVNGSVVNTILEDVLSHPITGANQGFTRPTDAPTSTDRGIGHDFGRRPLLKKGGQKYTLLDRSACAQAFVEAIFEPLRASDNNFDGNLGLGIERFLKGEFAKHGISCLSGKYKIGPERGECDLVIETADVIILIEVKKKPLTRQAQAGFDVKLFSDLSLSLLSAQVQAGWHEIRLREQGYLLLHDDSEVSRLELDGRTVERVALSFQDFGSFHDRGFIERFLNSLAGATLSATDPQHKEQLKGANIYLKTLEVQRQLLYPGEEGKRPFFNCWFFSLPQLLVLLDGVSGPEQFRDSLWRTRNLGSGSADLYYDIAHVNQMRDKNAQMYELLAAVRDRDVTFVL